MDKPRGRFYTQGVKEAIFRLIVISSLVITWGVAVILLLRSCGYHHQALDHPLMDHSFYLIAKGAGEGEAPSNSYQALKRTAELSPQIIAEIDLWLTKDHQWVIYGDGVFKTLENEVGKIHQHSLEDLKKKISGEYKSVLTLDRVFSLFPNTLFLLDIHHYEETALQKLPEIIHRFGAGQRVLIHSSFPKVLRLLRKKEPRWPYFPDQPGVMQAKIMSALFLEPLMDLPSDFIFQNLMDKNKRLPERMHREVLRRGQKVIAIVNDSDHWTLHYQKNPLRFHGVMTDQPSQFLQFLTKKY